MRASSFQLPSSIKRRERAERRRPHERRQRRARARDAPPTGQHSAPRIESPPSAKKSSSTPTRSTSSVAGPDGRHLALDGRGGGAVVGRGAHGSREARASRPARSAAACRSALRDLVQEHDLASGTLKSASRSRDELPQLPLGRRRALARARPPPRPPRRAVVRHGEGHGLGDRRVLQQRPRRPRAGRSSRRRG